MRVDVSFLISTYAGTDPGHLQEALSSILAQTVTPEQVVVVIDGPVRESHERVLERFATRADSEVTIVRLLENVGLAEALRTGIGQCRHEWIARLDSDDLCYPNRLEAQWAYISRHKEIDLLCSWHSEFETDVRETDRIKVTPETHDAIVKKLKWRNVISHPTVMMRRESVERAGSYRSLCSLQEDYDLYVRMAQRGARFAAVQQPLVAVRTTREQYQRRGGFNYLVRSELPLRYQQWKYGFCSIHFAVLSAAIRAFFILSPAAVKELMYRAVRHSPTYQSEERAVGVTAD